MVCEGFSEAQRQKFFKNNPVALVWRSFEPATMIIRSETTENFAKKFECLCEKYDEWTRTDDGQGFATYQEQAITACFFY